MIATFHCPACQASLDPSSQDERYVRCPYCNTTVIVPESLRKKSADPTSAFNVFTDKHVTTLAEVAQLMRNGRKIEAIKHYREAFGVGLQEAKEAVESIERGGAIQAGRHVHTQSVTAGEKPELKSGRVGCWIIMIVLLIAGLIAVPIFLSFGAAAFGIAAVSQETLPEVVREVAQPIATAIATIVPPTATPGFASIITHFGGEGTGPGRFNDTRHIGVDGEGRIYTADYQDGRVQVFDAEGKFITTWNAELDIIESFAVDRQGIVYAQRIGKINRYNGQTGEFLGEVPLGGGIFSLDDIYLTADGGLIAYGDDTLVRLDGAGKTTLRLDDVIREQDDDVPLINIQIAADGSGNIYLAAKDTIFKFDREGKFVTRIPTVVGEDDHGGMPLDMAVDGRGRIFLSAIDGIKIFEGNGRHVNLISYPGISFGLHLTDDDHLFIMNRNENEVQEFELNQ